MDAKELRAESFDKELFSEFFKVGKFFIGEIWEDDAGVPMQKGYSNDGKPFDIETAFYLTHVFRAIRNPAVLKVVIRAAVQTLKTFAVEKSASYFIKHHPGDMAFYDCDLEAAKDHAKSRLGPMLQSVPGIAEMIGDVGSRHDITTTEFYLPGMTLRMWPLNESSTQRITLRYVFISDAFLSKGTGMIGQAIARTTQHPKDKKIIIESQGSDEGDDFDVEFSTTNQMLLYVKCPLCGEGQPFEWRTKRKDGTYAGFQRGPDEKVLLENGDYNEIAIKAETHYECFHCRGKWLDEPETRRKLDHSSYFVATNPTADPVNVGFSWPAWINARLKWGDLMVEYLIAKKLKREHARVEKLKQFYQKRAAKTWKADIEDDSASEMLHGGYDPSADWPEEKWRVILVDCQEELSFFWYSVHGIAKDGKSRQLARGSCGSFGDIVKLQEKWNVPDQRVFLDAGHKQERLIQECAEHGHTSARTGRWICWQLFKGSGLPDFQHERRERGRVVEYYRHPISKPKVFYVRRGNVSVAVNLFTFSNLFVSDMAQRYRDGEKSPECRFLERQPGEPDEENDLSWKKQLHSEHKEMIRNLRTNLMEERWVLNKQHLPNHAWDLLKMFCAFLLKTGIAQNPMQTQSATADLTTSKI